MNDINETKKTIYIVFDTNDSFVSDFISYIIVALKCLGIDVISDKTGPEQKNSRFFGVNLVLVVFSRSYTFSVPCLNNLVELQKFRQEKGHVVVPVFYEESASVIKERVERGEAFAVHEESFSVDQVAKWRDVLVEMIELQDHDHDLSEDPDFIEKIVEDIFDKLCPTEHIGNQKVLKELQNLLCNQPWVRRTLGIVGEPGIGKTTLAKAAFRTMSSSYDTSRFITFGNEEITEIFSDEDFKEVPKEKFDLNQDSEPCQRPKRVLLVLDDVQRVSDVKDFLVGYDRFGPGSLLIITSRHREVLEECHVNDIYELKGLNNEDSLKLFTRCVFEKDVHQVDEESLKFLMKEIKHCDGNPSSILSCVENVKLALDQSDLQKFPELDLPKHMWNNLGASYLDPDSVLQSFDCDGYPSDLPRFSSLPSHVSDLSIPYVGQFVLVHLPHTSIPIFDFKKIIFWQVLMIDSTDLPDSTKTLLIDQIEPKILNLRGCVEIKNFQKFVQSIREWSSKGKILQYSLQRNEICTQCNSANETGSHLYFDITFSWSILTTLRNRIESWEVVLFALLNLTGSKAKKILCQMEWELTVYSLWMRRQHRLYRQSYRSSQVHRFIRYIASYMKHRRLKRRLDFFLKYFNSGDLEFLHPTEALKFSSLKIHPSP